MKLKTSKGRTALTSDTKLRALIKGHILNTTRVEVTVALAVASWKLVAPGDG